MLFKFKCFNDAVPCAPRFAECLLIAAGTIVIGACGLAQSDPVAPPPVNRPAAKSAVTADTSQAATIQLLSAGSAQNPAPMAAPTTAILPARPAPGSFAQFAHDLLTRDTLTGDWWGLRGDLDSHGITPTVTLLQAASENFSGGIRTNRIDWRYRLDVSLTLDTNKLFGWKGGTAFADFMAHGGQNPANDLVGALQAISAIDQNPATRLDQIWYRQNLLNGNLWFKLGRIDTTYDFDNIRDAQVFLNGSFGFSPSIFVFPSYPFSAWGGEVLWHPVANVTLHGGLFDGNTENTVPDVASTNPNAVENPYGILALAEESLKWRIGSRDLGGTFTLGQWYHTGTFQRYSGSSVQGAEGFYAYLDQTLWTFAHTKGLFVSNVNDTSRRYRQSMRLVRMPPEKFSLAACSSVILGEIPCESKSLRNPHQLPVSVSRVSRSWAKAAKEPGAGALAGVKGMEAVFASAMPKVPKAATAARTARDLMEHCARWALRSIRDTSSITLFS